MARITSVTVYPVAAPPTGFGGDARNIAQGGPTYANVVLEVHTDQPGLMGTAITFTNGHGLRESCNVTEAMARRLLLNKSAPVALDWLAEGGNLGTLARTMLLDSDYSWLGGVGISRMAIGAVINALWDLVSRMHNLPAWEWLARLSPDELLQFIDFEQISDVVSPAQALQIFHDAQAGKQERIAGIYAQGLLAYNTAGWSGISIDALKDQTIKMINAGWPQIKIKVGASYSAAHFEAAQNNRVLTRAELDALAVAAADDDIERLIVVYQTIDQHDTRAAHLSGKMKVAVDSNQVFDPRSAIVFISHLAKGLHAANPNYVIQWFEEPTNQHDATGHVLIQQQLNEQFAGFSPPLHVPVSTGEQGALPVMFKNLLHAPAPNDPTQKYAIDVIQMDYARVAGIADNLSILLLAQQARLEGRDVRICPHTGGIGLCEGMRNVQAVKQALFGSANFSGVEDILEFVAEETRSVHEGVFNNPAVVVNGYYQMNHSPGTGVDYSTEGLARYRLPDGSAWAETEKFRTLAQRFMLSEEFFAG